MEWNTIDWIDLVLRWFHIMAGISWIGGSLYLLWLDRIFANPDRATRGEKGEPWLIDLAGSLLVDKLGLGPDGMAKTHIWFKRETLLTWISGLLLLVMLAHFPGGGLLLDADGKPLNAPIATAMIAALLVLGWLLYDYLWRMPLNRMTLLPVILSLAIFVIVVWGVAQIFSGRALFILMGAVLGTLMMGNIWFRLLPALKEMMEARQEGRPADEVLCAHAKVRSNHSSYLIFPTVVLMISNHYPVLYSHHLNWLVLAVLVVAFILVRHLVVSGKAGLWALGLALVGLALSIAIIAAVKAPPGRVDKAPVDFTEVRAIVSKHCLRCHSTVPSDPNFGPTPGGIAFDQPEDIKRHAPRIKVRAVDTLTMPNKDGRGHEVAITYAERKLLGRWVDAGAKLE